jgi:hypothetical protein
MSGYPDKFAQERKRARPLYLELKALGVELDVRGCPADPREYTVCVGGLKGFSPAHADRLQRRVRASEEGLARVLLAGPWHPDLEAIRQEGESS